VFSFEGRMEHWSV